jgi:acyl-CoA thioester hydrolase
MTFSLRRNLILSASPTPIQEANQAIRYIWPGTTNMKDNELQAMLNAYPVTVTEEIIWGDMDAFQHVNNTVYFRYFESARMAFMLKTSMLDTLKQNNIGPILASTHCDFRAPLSYPDSIHIGARVTDIQERKISMEFIVLSEKLNQVAAEGSGLMVYYDYAVGKACNIPTNIVTAIQNLR